MCDQPWTVPESCLHSPAASLRDADPSADVRSAHAPCCCFDVIPSPAPASNLSVATPDTDAPSLPNMNILVGGALAPVASAELPARAVSFSSLRAGVSLRLPSFEALGIASPHPDRSGGSYHSAMKQGSSGSELAAELEAAHISPPSSQQGDKVFGGAARARPAPFQHDAAILTPPAESDYILWGPVAPVSHAAPDSPATDPGQLGSSTPQEGAQGRIPGPLPISARPASPSGRSWLEDARQALLESLRTAALPNNPLRVLSHALPSPSTTGHIFPYLIDAIHASTPAQPTVWINVFHAIQGRFNLADLPTSPPNTPGPAIGGDDYFTQKVFDTAVPISDYQQDLSSLPRSPRPVVPPSSIDVSIVERYIPPSTTHEFADMFNHSGPSILVDRLVELSPNNGTLVFIYPTRTGGEAFMNEYLGPLLDPQLRSLVVINGLSSNLSRSLGRMVAVDSLFSHEQMHRSMLSLCAKLTQRSSTIERLHGRRATFSLIHASRAAVQINRDTWSTDWWAKQEKQRIREMMTRYAQEAQKTSSNEHLTRAPTPTELIQQLLDGVTRKSTYPQGQEPTGGIEVSVFVIQRSS